MSYIRERSVIDVATEQPCPALNGQPHEIKAGNPGPGAPSDDPVWRCWRCGVTWADLDAAVRAPLPSSPRPRGEAPRPVRQSPLKALGISESDVKAWARARGHQVNHRGRVAQHLIDAYLEDQGRTS